MNRSCQGGRRDRQGGRFGPSRGGGGGDGLLGEGPGMSAGAMYQDQLVNQQLMLAQSLLQQQQVLHQQVGLGLGVGPGGPDMRPMGDHHMGAVTGMGNGNMAFMQQSRGFPSMGSVRMGRGPVGRMQDASDRKRMGQSRDRHIDAKRRRQDSSSSGRGGDLRDSRPRNKDNSRGSAEGRDKNRPSRWDTDKKDKKAPSGDDSYDPSEPTDADEVSSKRENSKTKGDENSNLVCHVCNISAYDEESFRRHLNGMKHANRMNSVLSVHELKSNQLKSRLKAEEHLRSIERKGGQVRDPEYFCKICNNDLTLPWKRHSFSNIHKQRLLQVRRGCGWCNVHDFTNFTEVLQHRETDQHKKNAELYDKKDKDGVRIKDKKTDKRASERKTKSVKMEEEEEDLTIPEFDAEKPVGLSYIIPVTGYFCKLCLKFYNNEKSAKGAHCQSEGHYHKLKSAIEAKIAAREKRKAEEAEAEAKRKAEERGKEEAKEGEGTNVDEDEEMMEVKEDGDHDESALIDDGENYNDELPMVDEDGEGGNIEPFMMKEDEEVEEGTSLLHPADQSGDASHFLDDTNADASFEFLSGDMARAELELQRAEEILKQGRMMAREEEEEEVLAGEENEDESLEATGLEGIDVASPTSGHISVGFDSQSVEIKAENDSQGTEGADGIEGSQGLAEEEIVGIDEIKMEVPVAAKTSTRRTTARRGRGRGKGGKK